MDIFSLEFWNELFSKGGLALTVLGLAIVFVVKVYTFIKKLRRGKEEVWSERMVRKIVKHLGAGQFLDAIIIVNDLLRIIPAEDMVNLLIEFRDKFDLKMEMKDSMLDLKNLLTFEKNVISNPIHDILSEYKRMKQVAVMKNKKRWNRLKKKKKVKMAMEGILSHYKILRKNAIDEARRKGRVEMIERKIEAIVNENNIERNRRIRHKIETFNEEKRIKEDEEKKKKMREDLYELFGGQKSANGS